MPKSFQGDPGAAESRKHRRRIVLLVFLVLLIALGSVLAIRLYGWLSRREGTRVVALVNTWNRMDDLKYTPHLTALSGGWQVDKSCAEPLEKMLADCAAAGGAPQLVAAYRDRQEQEQRYQAELQRLIAEGTDVQEAPALAARRVPLPGCEEHELCLAVDIADSAHPVLDEQQAETFTHQWLRENAWRYGFILRYPPDREDLTGMDYVPWHDR